MAQKRMFSLQIVDTDAFLDMPQTSQLLYFHLCMRADDEGFVGNPRKIMRVTSASDDDLKVLLTKRFLIPFESGVVVIKHWLIHNTIRLDRFGETTYREEKALLSVKENRAYTLATNGQPSGNHLVPQVNISKDNIREQNGHGEFQNVRLSADEHTKLISKYGRGATNSLIEELSTYLRSSGKRYKDHYATLLNWAKRKGVVEREKPSGAQAAAAEISIKPEEQAKIRERMNAIGSKFKVSS